ncbi:MAG: hypothetical protein ACYDA6_10665, partial [Solirubrobacteraceae bacterium]
DSEPSDPLRFDMYAQRLGNLLLPGITNRTERLRYLSMVCAGIAVTTLGRDRTLRQQRAAFLPFERGWALAMTIGAAGELKWRPNSIAAQPTLRPQFRGFRGVNRVLAHYRRLQDGKPVRPTEYTLLKAQDAQGGLGAYLVTLRQFGFVQPDSLTLTAMGRALAEAFNPRLHGAPISVLAERTAVKRSTLARLGEALVLGSPTTEERQLVREAIFTDPRSAVAHCVRRMRSTVPDATDPRALLAGIASRNGDGVEMAAQFAIHFDPLRVALLQLFARLGTELSGRAGSTPLSVVLGPEIEEAAEKARHAARTLAADPAVPGVQPVSILAADLAGGESVADTVRSMVSFHRREGRAWITNDRADRYVVGSHGSFEEPSESFNGYTVGRAIGLLMDAEAKA